MRRVLVALLACVVALIAAARTVAAPELDLPKELNNLKLTREEIGEPKKGDAEYLEEISLYSLRAGKQLEATLQVGRFRASAPTNEFGFRRSIAGQVGDTVPVEHRVADEVVFVSRGKRLAVAVWFRDTYMFVLSIRETYGAPKSLLRETLEVRP
jgi:hypothetical protein